MKCNCGYEKAEPDYVKYEDGYHVDDNTPRFRKLCGHYVLDGETFYDDKEEVTLLVCPKCHAVYVKSDWW